MWPDRFNWIPVYCPFRLFVCLVSLIAVEMRELLRVPVRVSQATTSSLMSSSAALFRGPARVVSVLLSAPVTHIGVTVFERSFMACCMLWSLVLTGVFQVRGRK